jgi:hypothetical protein
MHVSLRPGLNCYFYLALLALVYVLKTRRPKLRTVFTLIRRKSMALLLSLSLSARCTKCFQTFFTCILSSSHTPAALHFSHFFAFFLLAVCLATMSHLINTCLRRPNLAHLTIPLKTREFEPKRTSTSMMSHSRFRISRRSARK